MSKITITGCDFSNTIKHFEKLEDINNKKLMGILRKYGEAGVAALSKSTPMDTGKTASSWSYEIIVGDGEATLAFNNSAQNNGIPIAILIQYGHGTGTGGYVQPNDFINPAMKPIFQQIADDAWKEVRAK